MGTSEIRHRIAIALFAVLACAAPAAAQVPAEALARALELARDAATALAPRGARVDVRPAALDPRLKLAPCAQAEAYLPSGVSSLGHTRVGVRCTRGQARWNVLLPFAVQAFAPGLVAAVTLPAGATLAAGDLHTGEVEWIGRGDEVPSDADALSGRVLARPLAAGQPLRAADLQPRLWFAAGERVRVQTSGEGYAVSAEGQALSAGIEGRPVRVRVGDGPVLAGRAVGDHRVEVAL